MRAPAGFELRTTRGRRLWVQTGLLADDELGRWLTAGDERLLEASGSVAGRGRGATRKVTIGGRSGVWRHNRHGGMLGDLLADRFLSTHRLSEELILSETLRGQRIPTPATLLAFARWRRGFWRQHLVTEEVPGARTVFDARDDPAALAAAAELLDRLFSLGFWAPDLHPANLLWQESEQRCWVIDLAAARVLGRPLTAVERLARRKRFARYFAKHGGSVPAPFSGFLARQA